MNSPEAAGVPKSGPLHKIQERVPDLNLMGNEGPFAAAEMKMRNSAIDWLINHNRKRYPARRRECPVY